MAKKKLSKRQLANKDAVEYGKSVYKKKLEILKQSPPKSPPTPEDSALQTALNTCYFVYGQDKEQTDNCMCSAKKTALGIDGGKKSLACFYAKEDKNKRKKKRSK